MKVGPLPIKMAKKKKSAPKKKKEKKQPRKGIWGYLETALGYGLMVGGIYYILHDIHFGELWSQLGHIRWSWVALAIAVNISSYITWGLSWKWLLTPVADVSVYDSTRAVYAGQFANELLPARLGELFRAYLVSRWVDAEFVKVIPSVIASRLLDGIWSVAGVVFIAFFVKLPEDLLLAGSILGILLFGGFGSLLYFAYTRHRIMVDWTHYESSGGKSLRFLKFFLGHLAMGLQDIGISRHSAQALAVSPFWLLFQAISFWLVMMAYGLKTPAWAGGAVFLIIHFGTLLPNAPGNAGVYQFFCVLGLTLFGVHKTAAAGFSIVVYFILKAPIWLIGFVIMAWSGLKVEDIRKDIEKFKEKGGK